MINPQMIKVATDLINLYGSTITIKSASSTSYNTSTGQIETIDGLSVDVKATIESYSSEEIKGLIQGGDMHMTVSSDNLVVTLDNKIEFQGITYNILNIEPLYLEDVVVIYDLQVRK